MGGPGGMTGRAELRDGPEPRAGCAGWKVGELLFMAATICLVQLSVCLCCRFSLPPATSMCSCTVTWGAWLKKLHCPRTNCLFSEMPFCCF